SPVTEVAAGPFECPERRYVTFPVHWDVYCPEKQAGDRIAEQLGFPDEREIGGTKQHHRRNIEIRGVVCADDAGFGPIDGRFVSKPVAYPYGCGAQPADDAAAPGHTAGVAPGVFGQYIQEWVAAGKEK